MESGKHNLIIDIEKVIASKSSSLAKYTPNFIIKYLKNLIHQDEINFILDNNQDKSGVDFASGALKNLNVSCKTTNISTIPINKQGRYIFVSNHPMGGLDGLILMSELGGEFGDIKFVVNDLLMNIKPLEPIFVPVNKHGKMDKGYGEVINNAYASDSQIIYFPAGLCSRMIDGEIKDPEWKINFLKQALKYNRDIVPIYFKGRNSMFFYRLAKIRKFIGIKFNIEMIFLPDEMFKQKNRTFDIAIGTPISVNRIRSEVENGNSLVKICNKIRTECYSLRDYIL